MINRKNDQPASKLLNAIQLEDPMDGKRDSPL